MHAPVNECTPPHTNTIRKAQKTGTGSSPPYPHEKSRKTPRHLWSMLRPRGLLACREGKRVSTEQTSETGWVRTGGTGVRPPRSDLSRKHTPLHSGSAAAPPRAGCAQSPARCPSGSRRGRARAASRRPTRSPTRCRPRPRPTWPP